jgi:hypothetical protein
MDATYERWANRCLPLLVANEAGWVLLNPFPFSATWSGDDTPEGVTIDWGDEVPAWKPVHSHFGYGTITWAIPFLFRTSAGYNLLVRGLPNVIKDGIAPLEGLVETDWSVASFTMNWKFSRPGHTVTFDADEAFCLLVPQRRGELESFHVRHGDLGAETELANGFKEWNARRDELRIRKFLARYAKEHGEAVEEWQADYFRGMRPDGVKAPEHQTKLRLAPFEEVERRP